MLIIVWRTLGLDLATHKAQLGDKVTWVGYDIVSHSGGATVSIKASFLTDLLEDTVNILSSDVVGLRELRSYTGRANHVSDLLFGWKPFLGALWAALTQEPATAVGKRRFNRRGKQRARQSKAPRGMIWVKQVKSSLVWIRRFLQQQHGPLTRTWTTLDFFLRSTASHI